MKKHSCLLAALVLLIMAGIAHAGEAVNRYEADLDFISCAGEDVHFAGPFTVVTNIVTDGKGEINQIGHINLTLDGIGTVTANPYRLNWQDNMSEHYYPYGNPVVELTQISDINIISLGSAPNEHATLTDHFTFNANGTLTVDKFVIKAVCRG